VFRQALRTRACNCGSGSVTAKMAAVSPGLPVRAAAVTGIWPVSLACNYLLAHRPVIPVANIKEDIYKWRIRSEYR
jgi:hypothetical protein